TSAHGVAAGTGAATVESPPEADVVVIGAGVVGAAIAAELQHAGLDPLVIEAGIPGREVSATSMAWVNAGAGKTPRGYRLLNLYGLERHHALHEAGRAPWFHPSGSVEIRAGQGGPGRRHTADGERADDDLDGRSPSRRLTAQERAGHRLAADLTDAVWHPREGWVDTEHMVTACLQQLPAGRVLAPAAVTSITDSGDGGATITLTDEREIRARRVVLAAGNGAPALIDRLRPELSLLDEDSETAHVGLSLETYPVARPPTTVIRAPHVAIRPTRAGGLLIADHATAVSYAIDDPALLDVPRQLIERARALAPELGEIRPRSVRISPRLWPRHGYTVCGWLTDA